MKLKVGDCEFSHDDGCFILLNPSPVQYTEHPRTRDQPLLFRYRQIFSYNLSVAPRLKDCLRYYTNTFGSFNSLYDIERNISINVE